MGWSRSHGNAQTNGYQQDDSDAPAFPNHVGGFLQGLCVTNRGWLDFLFGLKNDRGDGRCQSLLLRGERAGFRVCDAKAFAFKTKVDLNRVQS